MTQAEKENLADRVVAVMRSDNPAERAAELRRAIAAGDEGEDGMNSVVLAIVQALLERGRL